MENIFFFSVLRRFRAWFPGFAPCLPASPTWFAGSSEPSLRPSPVSAGPTSGSHTVPAQELRLTIRLMQLYRSFSFFSPPSFPFFLSPVTPIGLGDDGGMVLQLKIKYHFSSHRDQGNRLLRPGGTGKQSEAVIWDDRREETMSLRGCLGKTEFSVRS